MAKPTKLNNRTHLRSHFIYFNLHKRCWSLKAERTVQPGDRLFHPSVKGRVTGHADTVLAVNCTTKISESGRQRVIREKRKNVHAGIVCTTCIAEPKPKFVTSELTQTMSYNPYKRGDFYDRDTGVTVTDPTYVLLRSGCNGDPPRVFYGNQLYYAHWAGGNDGAGPTGFLSSVELLNWIGLTEFDGKISCNGSLKYECREGHLFYADGYDRDDSSEYERLLDCLRNDGTAIATRTISKIVGKEFKQK